MQQVEKWIPVRDYEGLYEVSDLGRIKSLPRKMYNGYGYFLSKEKILKVNRCTLYNSVMLRKNNTSQRIYVHRIVYESFNGKTNLQIDHIVEGNKRDNRLCNLQALSHRENSIKFNQSRESTSKYTGVHFVKKRNNYRSVIRINGKNKHLGIFLSELDAHNAYQNALNLLTHPKKVDQPAKLKPLNKAIYSMPSLF